MFERTELDLFLTRVFEQIEIEVRVVYKLNCLIYEDKVVYIFVDSIVDC